MELVLGILNGAASLVLLVCFIVVVVKMFQNKQTGLGIASIIGLFCLIGYVITLVVGWKNRTAWRLEKIMPIFSIAFAVTVALTSYSLMTIVKQGFEEVQQSNTEFEGDLDVPEIVPESTK